MKKVITMLLMMGIFLLSAKSQSNVTYVDSIKTVKVEVSTNLKKQQDLETWTLKNASATQLQLSTVISNQQETNANLSNAVNILSDQIKQKNKNDSKFVTDLFGYNTDNVKHSIKIERWLNFTTIMVMIIYLFSVLTINGMFNYRGHMSLPALKIRMILYTGLGIIYYLLLKHLLTYIFNGDYFVIKELMKLYG